MSMWKCLCLFVAVGVVIEASNCIDGDCSLENGEGLIQISKTGDGRREQNSGKVVGIPADLCVETIGADGKTTHAKVGRVDNTATRFTKDNKVLTARRKYQPGSVFQPSLLTLNDNPAQENLPEPRDVSVQVCRKPRTNAPLSPVLNLMTMTFGQFIDHDIALVEEHFDTNPHIAIDLCDRPPNPTGLPGAAAPTGCDLGCAMERFPAVCQNTKNGLQSFAKINQINGFLEGHNVYGTTQHRQDTLRSNHRGRLHSQKIKDGRKTHELPPYAVNVADDNTSTDDVAGGPPGCGGSRSESNPATNFLCGDIRCTENTALLAMHTVWLREHNREARRLWRRFRNKDFFPTKPAAQDNFVYTHARAHVVASIQSVLMYEFLPAVLGQGVFDKLIGPYKGYDASQNPSISDAFAAAFYRFGHTLIADTFNFRKNGKARTLDLVDSLFNSAIATKEAGIIDVLLRGEMKQQAEDVDVFMADGVRDDLFNEKRDLAALNIARSRDHQIAFYAQMRTANGLRAVTSFQDRIFSKAPKGTVNALTKMYGTPDRCDVFVCMLAENKVDGSQVGELLGTVLAKEYKRMRAGDQMWFENTAIWNKGFINRIKSNTMTEVLRKNLKGINTDFLEGSQNAFVRANFV